MSYEDKDIKVLKGLEGIRLRPGMYLEDPTEKAGILQMISEVRDNSTDEYLGGFCDQINIVLDIKNNEILVSDNGRGIPQKSIAITYGKLHAGGKFDEVTYKVSGGLHGVGGAVVNALSDFTNVYSKRKNKVICAKFKRGKCVKKEHKTSLPRTAIFKKAAMRSKNGTFVHYKPDYSILTYGHVPLKELLEQMDVYPLLCPKLKVCVETINCKDAKKHVFYSKKGMAEHKKSKKDFYYKSETLDVLCKFLGESSYQGYVNLMHVNSGTHTDGFWAAFKASLSPYVVGKKAKMPAVKTLRETVDCTLHALVADPLFIGQAKNELGDKKIRQDVSDELKKAFSVFFKANKPLAKKIIKFAQKTESFDKARKAEMKSLRALAKETKNGKLPTNLAASTTKDWRKRELFLVEGESAAGGCKTGRDKIYQEVLGLKGKILNVTRATMPVILASQEVQDIVKSVGSPNPQEGRVGKVFLFADADPDGPLDARTKVPLLNGTYPTIKELARRWSKCKKPFWVYGRRSDGVLIPCLAESPKIATYQNKEVHITLDNGHVLKCSEDHKWAINNAVIGDDRIILYLGVPYVRAKDLTVYDSLNSMYLAKTTSEGYASKKYPGKNKYLTLTSENGGKITLHRWVKQYVEPDKYAMYCKANKHSKPGFRFAIHHRDEDGFNNEPRNLAFTNQRKHFGEHGKRMAIAYNGSAKHLQDIQNAKANGAYSMGTSHFIDYNKTAENSKSTTKLNYRKDVIDKQLLGKYARTIIGFYNLDLPVNKETWEQYKSVNAIYCKWDADKIVAGFNHIYYKQLKPKDGYTLIKKTFENKACYPTQAQTKFVYFCKEVLKANILLNREGYTVYRSERISKGTAAKGTPKWSTGLKHCGLVGATAKKVRNYVKHYNHSILKIKTVNLKRQKPFYCMTVPETGNFMVDDGFGNGVLSANSHINALTINAIIKLLPEWIEQGRVYIVNAPLFHTIYKGKRVFGDTLAEVQKQVSKSCTIMRAKGLGECKADDLKYMAFKDTRRVTQLKGSEKAYAMVEYWMQKSPDKRKQFLGLE